MASHPNKFAARNRKRSSRPGLEALESRIAMSLGGESLPSAYYKGQFSPATASSTNGQSVVVWVEQYSSTDTDIKAQRYSATGSKLGGTVTINDEVSRDSEPAVAMDSYGDFVVTWTRDLGNGDRDIRAARFSSAGTNRAGANSSILVTPSTKPEYDSSVAVAYNGDFVVSYTLDYSDTDQDVRARMYADNGTPLGSDFGVATTASRAEYASSVARTTDGRFAIAYGSYASIYDNDIILKRYSSTGALVNTHNISTSGNASAPSVAMDSFGNTAVAYHHLVGDDWDIKVRKVDTVGVMGSEMIVAASQDNELLPVIALHRTSGRFVVAYKVSTPGSFDSRIAVRELSSTGSTLATYDWTTHSGLDARTEPAISIDVTGNYTLAYRDLGATSRVFHRRGRI